MAVHTPLTDDEIKAFVSGYDVGDFVRAEPILAGIENTNYQLHTNTGRFVLTLFERRTKVEDLPYFMSVLGYFADAGLPVAAAVPDQAGDRIGRLKNKAAIIVPWLEGKSQMQPSAADCAAMGEMLGRMHQLAPDCPAHRYADLGFVVWQKIVPDLIADAKSIDDDALQSFLKVARDAISYMAPNWPATLTTAPLPIGVIHCDLFPDNVLMQNNRVTGLIDFYFSCNDWLVYDLAVTLNSWCFQLVDDRATFQADNFKAMLAAYQAIRPLQEVEKTYLPMMLQGSALRFLITRLEDWLPHLRGEAAAHLKPKNPQEFADILAFHLANEDVISA